MLRHTGRTRRHRWALLVAALLVIGSAACGSSGSGTSGGQSTKGITGTTAPTYRTLSVGEGQPYTTIQAAVDAAKPGDLILIHPGVYKEEVIVETENIVLRGVDRNKVIIDGEFTRENGIKVFANGIAVENLTSRNHKGNGIFFTGDYDSNFVLTGYRVSYVTAYNNGNYGIYAFNATKGQFDHSYGSGHPDSAFYIGQCKPCDAVVTDVIAENNALGYSGTNSTGVSVVNSVWRNNRIGIVPNSQDTEKLAPVEGTLVAGNLVVDNNNGNTPLKDDAWNVAFGSGIVATGVNNVIIRNNRVENNKRVGIIVVIWPFGTMFIPRGNQVLNNISRGAETYGDLVLGLLDSSEGPLDNCFSGNEFVTSRPIDLEKIAPCGGQGSSGFETLDINALLPGPAGVDYKSVPAPPEQPTMPDATTAPPVPADSSWSPVSIDPASIVTPAPA
ncbi:MAG: right-handed parallel beta-helix repeat-containing protein [Acidimicrobiales bacterium]|nr:right-handed parallel beta-helix repeat-containing protein [Acidimicrobiales bacterium]